ncbi:hypothetical protein CPY51_30580 [Rhizobium tubonense]|uniref:Uncharacterized protein n=1 Tax=Rhizobium tubonense TaxID=484088 RepID=A0A2W4C203_9HYPH|nr:hypothetical protein CPY51_30580 [Rhizobium tubonense]
MKFFSFMSIALLAAVPALADQKAAEKCGSDLRGDSRVIYDVVSQLYKPGSDLRALVTEKTRGLAEAGKIDKGSARSNAMAAGRCLEKG